jgi:HK97 gp10 family phage protein
MARARFRVRLEGNEELQRALRQVPETLRRDTLKQGVRDAAEVILKAAKAIVPRGATGVLVGSLIVREVRSRNKERVSANVTTTKEGFYAHFVEYGTHNADGSVRMDAKPFMRPALLGSGQRAVNAGVERVKQAITPDGGVKGLS